MRFPFIVLMTATMALLGACTDSASAPPVVKPPVNEQPEPVQAIGNRLTGQLAPWTYTSALLGVGFAYNDVYSDMTPAVIPASGVIDSALPTIEFSKSLLDGCALSKGFQGSAFKYDIATFPVFSSQADHLGQIYEKGPNDTAQLRLYSTGAGPLKGQANCADGEQFTFDASIQAGWNLLNVTVSPDQKVLRLVNATAASTLVFRKAAERVVIQPTSPAPIRLKRGASVRVPVKVFQDGGISGVIALSTWVDGLEITPASITLSDNVGKLSLNGHTIRAALPLGLGGPLSSQAVETVLTLSATDFAAEVKGALTLHASKGGVEVGTGVLNDFQLLTPQLGVSAASVVAPQTLVTRWPIQVYTQGYQGDVRLSVTDLPSGLTLAPQTVKVAQNQTATVTFSIDATPSVPVGHWPVTLKAEQLGDGIVVTQRALLTVMPKPVRMVEGTSTMAVDAAGNLWYSGSRGMYRQGQDGTSSAFTDPGPRCGNLTAGEDGGIWEQSAPQVRFDAVTGSATVKGDPRGFSGCAGSGMHFDTKGRGWDWYFNIQRLDYAAGTFSNVPGAQEDQLLDVDGQHVWGYTQVGGTPQLVSIDADSLARETLVLPGINRYQPAYGRGGKLWLPKSVPSRLAVYDPGTGQVSQMEVKIDGQAVPEFGVLGVDQTGRHWLEIPHVDGDLFYREWVLYNPVTTQVVKRVPAIFLSGSGTLSAVSPDGVLWVRTADQPDDVPYAYAFKP